MFNRSLFSYLAPRFSTYAWIFAGAFSFVTNFLIDCFENGGLSHRADCRSRPAYLCVSSRRKSIFENSIFFICD